MVRGQFGVCLAVYVEETQGFVEAFLFFFSSIRINWVSFQR
jgi:hypothetical protein